MARIPKILHYIFGMAADFGGKPWSLVHYVCLRSALERIKPETVFLYYQYEPEGPWWELSRGLVTLVKIDAPQQIFNRQLIHVAHKSDVVRLQVLIEHGGIYLDADVLVQRSFDDLLDNSVVLGSEGSGRDYGLANALILAEPNAPFLCRWLEKYRSFRSRGHDLYWNEHSVQLPKYLAEAYPAEVTVLGATAFYWPLWTEEHLDWIFRSTREIPPEGNYANHLWESEAWRFLSDLTPGQVRAQDTNFSRWVEPLIDNLPDNFGAPSLFQRVREGLRTVNNLTLAGTERAKYHLKSECEPLFATYSQLKRATERKKRRRTFENIYKKGLWGNETRSKYFSGVGSRGEALETYVSQIAELLANHSATLGRSLRVVDIGCGDFQVGHALSKRLPAFTYIGCDIVPDLIAYNNATYATSNVSFHMVDLVSDRLPDGDVCLVRQVLQHLPNADIAAFFKRANYEWIYVTEGHPRERKGPINPDKRVSHDVRFDWRTGKGRGVELDRPPFSLVTKEIFRTFVLPNEVIITERVFGELGAPILAQMMAEIDTDGKDR